MDIERGKETTVTIAELAAQKEVSDQVQYQEILGELKETGGIVQPQTPISEILSASEHKLTTPGRIQVLTNPLIVNEGSKGSVDNSKTWKEMTDKRKGNKRR